MIPDISRLNRIPLLARALIAGGGLTALLSLALAAPGRGHRARRPPVPVLVAVLPQPESKPIAGPLTLTSLTAGAEPRVWSPGRQVVRTFVTEDGETCHVLATARLAGGGGPESIRWTLAAPAGFVVPVEGKWTGPRLDVVLRRPGGNPTGLGGPLSLTVQARAEVKGLEYTARETVVQDEVDQLRQEYIDLARRTVPDRSQFLDAATFAARYGRAYPWLQFADLNWSVNPTTRLRYSYAIVQPELVQGLDRVRRAYGSVVINSGYRNPVRQVEVHAPVRESLHQYGYAADLAVTPTGGRLLPNEVDWRRLAEIACGAAAKWIEPLAASAPNSPGCHVHMDYRPGPVSSAPVHLRGQVVEAETGKPVAGALVLLGAMPARTDAGGFFGIRNVLSGGPHPVEVRADGYELLIEPVRLTAWGTASARLAVHAPLRTPVTVAVARAGWSDPRSPLLAVTLRLSNLGGTTADDVRVSVSASGASVVSVPPTQLGSLPPGAVRGVQLALRPLPGQRAEPIRLTAGVTLRRAGGPDERSQVHLSVAPPSNREPTAVAVARKPAAPVQSKTAPAQAQPASAPPVKSPPARHIEPPKNAAPAESSTPSPAPAKLDPVGSEPKAPSPAPVPAPAPAPGGEAKPAPADETKPPAGTAPEQGKPAGAAAGLG